MVAIARPVTGHAEHVGRAVPMKGDEWAQKLELFTWEAVQKEWRDAKVGWGGYSTSAADLRYHCVFCNRDFLSVSGARKPVRSVSPPRFPSSTRDISFWIDAGVAADDQRTLLMSTAEPLLRELAVLEDYRDPKYAPPGKKGMLWTLTYRADDRTLTDAEVDAAHARIVAVLKASPSVTIR